MTDATISDGLCRLVDDPALQMLAYAFLPAKITSLRMTFDGSNRYGKQFSRLVSISFASRLYTLFTLSSVLRKTYFFKLSRGVDDVIYLI